MTRISGDWMTRPETAAVMDMLTGAGQAAYFVGGCVRDAVAGRPVRDIDIATDAPPDRVQELAGEAGLKAVPTGAEHGTITVVSGEKGFEVTTFRRDVATDGRRAVVAFSGDIADDAARRDLTLNALYARPDGTVVDPIGTGLADLRAGRVRFVGNPVDRVREDYLRILRYFRFFADFGRDGPDPEALAAIAENLDGLEILSAERVGHEMLRLLATVDPAPALAAMASAGVLARVLPGADASAVGPLVHLEQQAGVTPDAIRRLAAMGGEEVDERLRLSRADARRLAQLREAIGSGTAIAELGYRLGREEAQDVALLRAALSGSELGATDLVDAERGAVARFPVAAADLMPEYEGAALGDRLKRLEARWIASDFALTREDLLRD